MNEVDGKVSDVKRVQMNKMEIVEVWASFVVEEEKITDELDKRDRERKSEKSTIKRNKIEKQLAQIQWIERIEVKANENQIVYDKCALAHTHCTISNT